MDVSKDKIVSDNVPEEFECPITLEIMLDAVVMPDGHSYSLKGITEWAQQNGKNGVFTSPVTREDMKISDAKPNLTLRSFIERYQKGEVTGIKAQPASTAAVVTSTVTTDQATTVNSSTAAYSYATVMGKLGEYCKGKPEEVDKISQWAIQTAIAMAGLYVVQREAKLEAHSDGRSVCATINFASAPQYHRFLLHYRGKYPGFIIQNSAYDAAANKATITVDSKVLHEQVGPALDEYGKLSHQNLMETLATKMNVKYIDVHQGDVVESRLVKMAGIKTPQTGAMFRRDPEYTTRFHLKLADVEEYQKLITYYNTTYPMFIVKEGGFKAGDSVIHVNTKILEDTIAPALKNVSDGKCIVL